VLYLISGEEQRAEQLRKAGDFSGSKKLYKKLWLETKNPKCVAGYLHCMRKLNEKKEAVNFAYELKEKNLKNSWVDIEILWTLLLFDLKSKTNFYQAKELADYLQELIVENPYKLATDILTDFMIKISFNNNKFEDALHWLEKMSEDKINDEQVGKSEWTNKSLCFYRKIKCLFKLGRYDESLGILEKYDTSSLPWSTQKHFLQLKAKILSESNDNNKALELYEKLTKGKSDWQVRYEKGKLLIKLDKKEDALIEFYTAASSFRQLGMLVNLFDDIGDLCLKLKKVEEALPHFILEKLVRKDKGWQINQALNSLINSLLPSFPQYEQLATVKDTLSVCKEFWKKAGVQQFSTPKQPQRKDSRKKRVDLYGSITGLDFDKNFCFIMTEDEKIFCLKSTLDKNIQNYDEVVFDAIPSFDKKKNKESWKAINVRKIN